MQNLDKDIRILFEDNHVLVLDKPHCLLTQPTDDCNESLVTKAKAYIKIRDKKPGNVFLEAIHRIDKPVRGIVVIAKTSKSLSRLMKAIREKKCLKIYHALVTGDVIKSEGTLSNKLIHGHHKAELSPEGKDSILHYKVIKKIGKHTLLEIKLDTGRYHQIRIQLSLMGWPIVGDKKYGSDELLPNGAIALEHYKFSFPHPTTGLTVEIELKT
jgi:23S rRNA pseudouridine1911/1915/1917 synthase